MTLIDKPPSLTEAIRRTQRILHELHIHHLPLRHIHFAQTAKGESVSLPMAILGAVDEVAQNGDVLGLVRGIGGVGSAERGTDVELLDGPVPADVDESLVNCGWAGLVVGAALGLDLGQGRRFIDYWPYTFELRVIVFQADVSRILGDELFDKLEVGIVGEELRNDGIALVVTVAVYSGVDQRVLEEGGLSYRI
ncbi:hypothetical protein LTR91_019423 [Friedmanniomyces endolithicus]|uniref:Uncharacterized protein n=1 Tax=Friedmanniomyces endolithicus TaxID=329885 RepID=A0AAN6K474_9PEZI|nr:hypothetical protein LTS00_012777 [Friedmanniomyces endolithicus]KAK0962457.1 hypothetical protein LTR91_019423 [Friedmanniomyces endolithicus]KAK1006730.1 hypothetical protein LTR54_006487 [Friedmanniomyces endolithicus]KAK1029036.1 hypothetical protein LTS16_020073 [Friedmanniomyces endolithicus]